MDNWTSIIGTNLTQLNISSPYQTNAQTDAQLATSQIGSVVIQNQFGQTTATPSGALIGTQAIIYPYSYTGDFIDMFSDASSNLPWSKITSNISAMAQPNIYFDTRGSMNIRSFDLTDFSVVQAELILGANSPLFEDVFLYSKNDVIITAGGNVKLIGNNLYFNGSLKTAIVPTSQGYRALYCMESPEVWFMDFVRIKRKKWWQFWKKGIEFDLDPLFGEVTEVPYYFMPTFDKNVIQVWGKRKGYRDTRFEEKSQEEFENNEKFYKMAWEGVQ